MPIDEIEFNKSSFDKVEKMKKISSMLFYIAAVLFYLASIISFVGGNNNYVGVVWLCLGSTFLCLGSVYARKSRENEEKQGNEK